MGDPDRDTYGRADLGTGWFGSMEEEDWREASQASGAACLQGAARRPCHHSLGTNSPSLLPSAKKAGGQQWLGCWLVFPMREVDRGGVLGLCPCVFLCPRTSALELELKKEELCSSGGDPGASF